MKKLTPIEYGRMACETIMQKYEPEKLPPYYKEKNMGMFAYHQGVFLSGMNRIFQKTREQNLFDYMKAWVDSHVDENGKIVTEWKGGWCSLETLDFRQPGLLMYPLYEETKDERYMSVVKYLVESLKDYPTNSKGGFWHMTEQDNQMWLDGLYMAGPITAMYADKFQKPEFFDLAATQVIVMYENMKDEKSGLLVHGWEETGTIGWANPKTGKSQEVWGRAMGWYVTALVDILDYIPEECEKRQKLIAIEKELLETLVKYQDESGRWYQVVDKGGQEGNWLENSCSCLITYALAKAVKKGYLEPEYYEAARKGYEGVIDSLYYDEEGLLQIGDICVGTCIDDGDYQHYINRGKAVNDLHGSGAFVLMCSEFEYKNVLFPE
ncbi:MAG: glycoside hydrolase family 88 protein [Lachnospiraceae bacterium]|nr:glycoside hydrolase family 88 protein [Lachnospiraceae bacterium]